MKILPLMVDHRPDGSIEIQKEDGVPVAVMCYSAASAQNAEEICNRVNCHEELVQALEDAIIWLEQCAGFKAPASRATMANYRAILAKAKPEA